MQEHFCQTLARARSKFVCVYFPTTCGMGGKCTYVVQFTITCDFHWIKEHTYALLHCLRLNGVHPLTHGLATLPDEGLLPC